MNYTTCVIRQLTPITVITYDTVVWIVVVLRDWSMSGVVVCIPVVEVVLGHMGEGVGRLKSVRSTVDRCASDGLTVASDVISVVSVTTISTDGIRVGVSEEIKPSTTPSNGSSFSASKSRFFSVREFGGVGRPSGKLLCMKDCIKLFGSSPEPSPSRNKSSAVIKSGSSRPGRKTSLSSNFSPLGFYKMKRSPRYSRFCLTFFLRFFTPFFFLRFLASTCTESITKRNRTKTIP